MNGYNRLAPMYDSLAILFVGKQIQQAQLKLLHHLKDCRKALILGGGTGWILPYIFQINPTLQIDYVDNAACMIDRARAYAGSYKTIRFILGTEAAVPDRDYDAVVTNFFVDLFSDQQLTVLIEIIRTRLTTDAYWLVTDFEAHTSGQRLKVNLMYKFFRIVTGLTTGMLPMWFQTFTRAGFILIADSYMARGFIRAVAFRVKIK